MTRELWAISSAAGVEWRRRLKKLGVAVIGSEHAGRLLVNSGLDSKEATQERNLPRLIRTLNELTKWPFEDDAAQRFGRIRYELRCVGRVMSVVDMLLAAIAFALGNCTVVTKDSDLSAVPGLQVENWATV